MLSLLLKQFQKATWKMLPEGWKKVVNVLEKTKFFFQVELRAFPGKIYQTEKRQARSGCSLHFKIHPCRAKMMEKVRETRPFHLIPTTLTKAEKRKMPVMIFIEWWNLQNRRNIPNPQPLSFTLEEQMQIQILGLISTVCSLENGGGNSNCYSGSCFPQNRAALEPARSRPPSCRQGCFGGVLIPV